MDAARGKEVQVNEYYAKYQRKLRTPEEAVKVVKSGDWVDYTSNVCFPTLLDRALAKRRDELFDVKFRGNLSFGPIEVAEADPTREHFCYNSWHFSAYERKLSDRGLCSFIPMIFSLNGEYYKHFLDVNVAMMAVTPMDKHGYFNLSCATGVAKAILDKADIVSVEVNERLPKICGGFDQVIHIDEVDYVVEGEHPALPQVPIAAPTPQELKMADFILEHVRDGCSLQLGIGSLPNVIGARLAESDLKDLGMHTELCGDAYYQLYQAGKLTNKDLNLHRGQGMTGMVFGTQELYEWVDDNPTVIVAPLTYVNDVRVIGGIDNVVSINNCVEIDLYGQISSESHSTRQISGTGGQLDFLEGAALSKGGKGFICMTSTFRSHDGVLHSRIKPSLEGDIATAPRSQAYFMVTEYGCVNLVGRSTWERAEMLISLAHPDFRDDLVKAAESQGIWRRSNRR